MTKLVYADPSRGLIAFTRYFVALPLLLVLVACGTVYRDTGVQLMARSDFEADRYLGLWYEIARYPVFFQEGCTATTAQYAASGPNRISVVNTCRIGAPDGPVEQVTGQADIVGPGRLKVSFENVPFVRGDYVVLWVDEAYKTAVVGVPSGKAGWILARSPAISQTARDAAETVLRSNGYDPDTLIDVPHL